MKKKLAKMGGDGTDPDAGFFEGAEKLLEVWFFSASEEFKSLRTIGREDIDWLLTLAKCTVISVINCEHVDAYLLSESSLFVYDDMIVLKTCGSTTLLYFLPEFLKIAAEKCNATDLQGLWYSRKNMAKPRLQIGLHQNFHDEVSFLDKQMSEKDLCGGAYMLGRMNGDHWYLYALETPEWDKEVECTFEVLMSDLNDDLMKQHFYCDSPDMEEQRVRGKVCTRDSGIGDLLPGVTVDESMFYPCGYSMNGVKEKQYYTIHVTPQPECSYASFETNERYTDYETPMAKLMEIFQPSRFIVNLTTQDSSGTLPKAINGFVRRDLVQYQFGRYQMSMGHYVNVKRYAHTPSMVNLFSGSIKSSDEDDEEKGRDPETEEDLTD